MNKRFKIILGVTICLFVIVLWLFMHDILDKDNTDIKLIKYSVVNKLYKKVKNDKVVGNKKYVSKLYGYSSDMDENIYMNVKEGYILNNQVYDLDNNVIGVYSEDTINDILDSATMKVYEFNKKSGEYVLNDD